MNIAIRFLVVGLSLFSLILIFGLVIRKELKEKYAILWIFSGITMFTFAVFDNILDRITQALGIVLSVNTVFFFGIFFLILINIHFSVVISNLSEQNKKIAQKLSLLEAKKEKV